MKSQHLTTATFLLASVCWAQPAEFEVASIKVNNSGRQDSNFNRMAGGGVRAINVTLRGMILFAYDIREQQLVGAPSWLDSVRYDVEAKPAEKDNPTGAKRSFEEDFRSIRVKM